MANKIGPQEADLIVKFGGGLHTLPVEDQIADTEAADGHNFNLQIESTSLKPRAPFDLLGTTPNGSSITGGGSYRKSDGTVVAFVQAGTAVYEWNGTAFVAARTFTVTIASPGVFSLTGHGFVAGDTVVLSTTGALPTGLAVATLYYVISAGLTADAFELSATSGGSAINTSGTQSGVHSVTPVLDLVDANAELRGHWRSHSWDLDGLLLISDLALMEPAKQWNGTTWGDIAFKSNPSTSWPNSFLCKYINVTDERAFYGHVKDGSSTLGHMVVGSQRSNHAIIDVSDRPASSLGEGDPFFLLTPDLRVINGLVQAFGVLILSTNHGRMFKLEGASAKDFAFTDFYPGSFASGDESLAYIGNDMIFGRQGRIESLTDTDKFGDSASDDLSKGIADSIAGYTGWTVVYNSRLNRVYLFPDSKQEVWVFDTGALDGDVSPWMRWTTKHSLAFQPTFVASMLDPSDGLEYIFMGGPSGKFYRLEGTGTSGDGGSSTIQTQFVSKLFSLPLGALANRVQGWIRYKRGDAVQVNIDLLYAGESVYDDGITVNIPQSNASGYYTDGYYYTDGAYYGNAFINRVVRQRIEIPGGDANEFQVRVTVDSAKAFEIIEIGLRFSAKA